MERNFLLKIRKSKSKTKTHTIKHMSSKTYITLEILCIYVFDQKRDKDYLFVSLDIFMKHCSFIKTFFINDIISSTQKIHIPIKAVKEGTYVDKINFIIVFTKH